MLVLHHQVLACIASNVVSALYALLFFVVVHTLLSGTKELDAKKKGKGKNKNIFTKCTVA